jgi:hypothetical protein
MARLVPTIERDNVSCRAAYAVPMQPQTTKPPTWTHQSDDP